MPKSLTTKRVPKNKTLVASKQKTLVASKKKATATSKKNTLTTATPQKKVLATKEPVVTRHIRVTRILPRDAPELQLHALRGRLRVAVYADFFPVAYASTSTTTRTSTSSRPDKYKGLDIDLIKGFCRAAGLRPQFVRAREWSDIWEQAGEWGQRIDVAVGGISRGGYRRSPGVEWTVPYFAVRRTVVYRLSDPIRKFPDDVTGIIAGTMGSTGMDDAIQRLRQKFGRAAWDHLDARWKTTDAKDLRDLLKGKIQGLMRGSFVGKAIVAEYPTLLGMTEPWDALPSSLGPYGTEVFAFPCRRGSGLAAQLNAYLVHASHNGTLQELVKKYNMQ